MEAFSVFLYIPLKEKVCATWLLEDAGVSVEHDVLIGLYRKEWLQFDLNQESYALHPVFIKFIYDKYKPKMEKHFGLIESCKKSLEVSESGNAIQCQLYIPFAESLINKSDMGRSKQQAKFIFALAYLFHYIAEFEKAEVWFKKSLKIYKDIHGDNWIDIANCYAALAGVYRNQEKYIKAKKLHIKSLEIYMREYGPCHPDTAYCYDDLAGMHMNCGEYEKRKVY